MFYVEHISTCRVGGGGGGGGAGRDFNGLEMAGMVWNIEQFHIHEMSQVVTISNHTLFSEWKSDEGECLAP